tara:strand:- start:96 stop:806 length:711 start_codon:yes stop_codon:yes gene_type:complete
MKKIIILIIASIFTSCNNSNQITITKLKGSPSYENSKLKIQGINFENEKYEFSFEVKDYKLGAQTQNNFNFKLANSGKGQHIHFIINNNPYSAHYTENFTKQLKGENNVILAFLSRSHHESVKNKDAFILTQIGKGEKTDLNDEFLFYSRPKGVYKGKDTEKLLLDFYLVNTKISADGNKVRATILDTEFIIDEWAPYYIEGLPKGEISIKLELLNEKGDLIDSPFNPSIRTVTLE